MAEKEGSQALTNRDVAHQSFWARPDYSASATLKRRASTSLEDLQQDFNSKRMKEEYSASTLGSANAASNEQDPLVEALSQELQCGCCAELVYRPVVVSPCQHFFCGSCCVLWIRNGGTHCPACRGASSIVTPSRPLQSILDILLRFEPSKTRAERERLQADEVYKLGSSLRIPSPREASPEPNLQQIGDYARPCPHCLPGNPFGWRCPQPIPDPNTDLENAWHLEDGTPEGHAYCGHCENLLALRAPSTSRCDLCLVSFCGIGVQGRCLAVTMAAQHPHGLSDIGDLIQSAEVYECFDSNTVEVEIMLDYLTTQRLTPRHVYREIVSQIQSQPRGFAPLMELELFTDVHGVNPGVDANPEAPRSKICRLCAAEVFLWGLRDWWIRERQKGFLNEAVTIRQDCSAGGTCNRQKDLAHAREFNHIVGIREPEPAVSNPELPSTLSESALEAEQPSTVIAPGGLSVAGSVDMLMAKQGSTEVGNAHVLEI